MPNLRGKTWTTTTPANVEDAQYWEDHLISDEDAAKIGTVVLPAGGTVGQVLTKQSSNPNDADWDDPASSGHTIQDEDGTDMPYQQTLQFVNAEISNDSVNDRTVVDCKGAKGDAATITVGTVSTLPAGSSATVVNSGTTKDAVFDFGIPEGADGTDGTDGEDGFSPTVTITTIPGGHRVNITDEEHPQGQDFDVMDGSGSGDMQASAYDPNSDVYNAGGIPDYVDNEITTAISGKADKVLNATNGNFAGLDSNGNLTDSGKKASDFMASDGVEANPTGTATGTLTSLGINGDKYNIPSGGSSTLADLTDVNISSPSDGQILQYDETSSKWVNGISFPIPDGSTITPTDDVQILLNCAGIFNRTSYSSISDVLNDSIALLAVISNENAVDYLTRSTTWATDVTTNSTAMSYIGANDYCADALLDNSTWRNEIVNSAYYESVLNEKIPTMTSNTQPKGIASADSENAGYAAWCAFNGSYDENILWVSAKDKNTDGIYLQYKFDAAVKANFLKIVWSSGWTSCSYQLQGSNDGSNFTTLGTYTDSISGIITLNHDFANDTKYLYYRLRITAQTGTKVKGGQVVLLQIFGRK